MSSKIYGIIAVMSLLHIVYEKEGGGNLSAYDLTLYKKNFNRKKVYLHTLSGNVLSGGLILLLVLSGKVLDKLLGMPFLKKLEQLTCHFS